MGAAGEWQEMCSVCGRMVGKSTSPCVARIVLDNWSYCETWEEICLICERCYTDIFLSGMKLRGVPNAKISDED